MIAHRDFGSHGELSDDSHHWAIRFDKERQTRCTEGDFQTTFAEFQFLTENCSGRQW